MGSRVIDAVAAVLTCLLSLSAKANSQSQETS